MSVITLTQSNEYRNNIDILCDYDTSEFVRKYALVSTNKLRSVSHKARIKGATILDNFLTDEQRIETEIQLSWKYITAN